MQSILAAKEVNRIFGSGSGAVHALRDIEMEIRPGKLTVLRGRSGSGKTCMINLLGALDKPSSGKVFFADKEMSGMSENARDALRRKNFGFVFQSVALISSMSALENVEFGLRLAKFSAKERQRRAEECLAFVGLDKRMKHMPGELSGGEQQRVAIARAIAHKPRVIFADEPTAELDSRMGLQVVMTFRDLVEQEGATIVMTTHDPQMIELCDEVYTLQDGEVIEHQITEAQAAKLARDAATIGGEVDA
jgi:putative ABC transport system ATP-binding protein